MSEVNIHAIDYSTLTDDDISDLITNARLERAKRSTEPKKPMYYVKGDGYYKNLLDALDAVDKKVADIRNFTHGPEAYIKGVDDLIRLEREWWNESEYNLRPVKVWSC